MTGMRLVRQLAREEAQGLTVFDVLYGETREARAARARVRRRLVALGWKMNEIGGALNLPLRPNETMVWDWTAATPYMVRTSCARETTP